MFAFKMRVQSSPESSRLRPKYHVTLLKAHMFVLPIFEHITIWCQICWIFCFLVQHGIIWTKYNVIDVYYVGPMFLSSTTLYFLYLTSLSLYIISSKKLMCFFPSFLRFFLFTFTLFLSLFQLQLPKELISFGENF